MAYGGTWTAATPTLLGIPRELRDQIIEHTRTFVHPDCEFGTFPLLPSPALWLTCRRLYQEIHEQYTRVVHRYWSAEDDFHRPVASRAPLRRHVSGYAAEQELCLFHHEPERREACCYPRTNVIRRL